jgi:hypothetical protein
LQSIVSGSVWGYFHFEEVGMHPPIWNVLQTTKLAFCLFRSVFCVLCFIDDDRSLEAPELVPIRVDQIVEEFHSVLSHGVTPFLLQLDKRVVAIHIDLYQVAVTVDAAYRSATRESPPVKVPSDTLQPRPRSGLSFDPA